MSDYTTAGMTPEPDVSTIQQHPEDQWHQPCSPVTLVGVNEVTTLPARSGQFNYYNLGAGTANIQPLIDANPKIRRFYISSSAVGVIVGRQEDVKAAAQSGTVLAGIPVGWSPPFEGVHEPLYAYSAAGGQTLVTRVEYWAD